MNKIYSYASIFAPFIEGLIHQKRADGFIYDHEAYILKKFDEFYMDKGISDIVITRDLAMDWAIQRPTEGINYRNKRISLLRQLSLYMNSLGIKEL